MIQVKTTLIKHFSVLPPRWPCFDRARLNVARKLATEATAKMKPLPVDEQKPVAGGADADDLTIADDLIMWMAYKEAKAMIHFDAAPAAPNARREMTACTQPRADGRRPKDALGTSSPAGTAD